MINQGKKAGLFNEIIEPDYAPGCALFINRNVIEKVGLLKEEYFAYYEDTDLSFRTKKAGYIIRVIPKSIIWHKVSQSTYQKNIKKIGTTQSYYLAKNGILFGLSNLRGLSKYIYLINQYTLKYFLYVIFKLEGVNSILSYTKGLFAGTKLAFSKYKKNKS